MHYEHLLDAANRSREAIQGCEQCSKPSWAWEKWYVVQHNFFFCSLESYLSWVSNNGLGLFRFTVFHLPSSLKKVKPGTVFGDQTFLQTDCLSMESLALEEIDIYMCGKMKNNTSILLAGHLEVKEPGGAGTCPLYKSPLGVKCHHFFKQPISTMLSKLLS